MKVFTSLCFICIFPFVVKSFIRGSADTVLSYQKVLLRVFKRQTQSGERFGEYFCKPSFASHIYEKASWMCELPWVIFKIANDGVTIITWFPWPSFPQRSKMTSDCCVFKFLQRRVAASSRDLARIRRWRRGRLAYGNCARSTRDSQNYTIIVIFCTANTS